MFFVIFGLDMWGVIVIFGCDYKGLFIGSGFFLNIFNIVLCN